MNHHKISVKMRLHEWKFLKKKFLREKKKRQQAKYYYKNSLLHLHCKSTIIYHFSEAAVPTTHKVVIPDEVEDKREDTPKVIGYQSLHADRGEHLRAEQETISG